MKKDVQEEEATEVNHDEEKIYILVVEDKCNAHVNNVAGFSVIS